MMGLRCTIFSALQPFQGWLLLHNHQPDMDALLKELSAYLDPGDLNEVKEIVGEIQGRIARFRKNTNQ